LAIAFLAALPAAAQIHGVPASVTSITPSRSTPGVPASVTSLGPNGYGNSRAGFQFGSGRQFGPGQHRGGGNHGGPGHRGHRRRVVPVYVPYYSYPYYAAYPDAYTAPASTAEYEAEDEEPPALTIYERRSRIAYSTGSSDADRYGEHYTDYREDERRRAKAEAQSDEQRQAEVERQQDQRAQEERLRSAEKPADLEPAAVLVFKDGHHQDVSGYAITGDVLYDLGQGRARKIQLADLDLDATRKLNDQLGNDFRLPSLPPKQD
jgi:hypothetical protein